jgi:ATP/maltotriose-dependent transcriptional regulator MalT
VAQAFTTNCRTPVFLGSGNVGANAAIGPRPVPGRSAPKAAARLGRAEALLRLIVDDLEAHLAAHFTQVNRNPGTAGEQDLTAENSCLQKKLHARIPATSATSASHPTPTRASHHPADSTLLTQADWNVAAAALHLSGRELQIVRDMFDNHTEHAMAADYGIADCTVHTHLERLYRKLAVTTRVALVLRVMTCCLYPDDPPV